MKALKHEGLDLDVLPFCPACREQLPGAWDSLTKSGPDWSRAVRPTHPSCGYVLSEDRPQPLRQGHAQAHRGWKEYLTWFRARRSVGRFPGYFRRISLPGGFKGSDATSSSDHFWQGHVGRTGPPPWCLRGGWSPRWAESWDEAHTGKQTGNHWDKTALRILIIIS